MSLQLESQPSLAHQAALARRKFRSDIAANAVADLGIDLRRHRRTIQPDSEIIACTVAIDLPIIHEPLVERIYKRDWLLLNFKPTQENSYPVNILRFIIALVAKNTNVSALEIRSARRTKDLILPRHTAMYLCKELTPKSYPEICRHFGDRDHTVGMYAVEKISGLILIDASLCQQVAEMHGQIEQYIADWRSLATQDEIQEAVIGMKQSAG